MEPVSDNELVDPENWKSIPSVHDRQGSHIQSRSVLMSLLQPFAPGSHGFVVDMFERMSQLFPKQQHVILYLKHKLVQCKEMSAVLFQSPEYKSFLFAKFQSSSRWRLILPAPWELILCLPGKRISSADWCFLLSGRKVVPSGELSCPSDQCPHWHSSCAKDCNKGWTIRFLFPRVYSCLPTESHHISTTVLYCNTLRVPSWWRANFWWAFQHHGRNLVQENFLKGFFFFGVSFHDLFACDCDLYRAAGTSTSGASTVKR